MAEIKWLGVSRNQMRWNDKEYRMEMYGPFVPQHPELADLVCKTVIELCETGGITVALNTAHNLSYDFYEYIEECVAGFVENDDYIITEDNVAQANVKHIAACAGCENLDDHCHRCEIGRIYGC